MNYNNKLWDIIVDIKEENISIEKGIEKIEVISLDKQLLEKTIKECTKLDELGRVGSEHIIPNELKIKLRLK